MEWAFAVVSAAFMVIVFELMSMAKRENEAHRKQIDRLMDKLFLHEGNTSEQDYTIKFIKDLKNMKLDTDIYAVWMEDLE